MSRSSWAIAAFLVLAIGYWLTPYVAAYRMAEAVQAKDVEALKERINVSAVRISLSRQIAAAVSKAKLGDKADSGGMGMNPGSAVVDTLIAPYVTPEAILGLFEGRSALTASVPEAAAVNPLAEVSNLSFDHLRRMFLATETRGFRAFLIAVPLNKPMDQRFKIVMRLSPSHGFMWRVTGIELPAAARDRLVAEFLKREGGKAG